MIPPERVQRALVSVHDKEGVLELCQGLAAHGIEILSSGGTARLLAANGVSVVHVADYTGFPEMLDGRVKTLHPRIHAGILAVRSNEQHMHDLAAADIAPIDLVVVNLYPFEATAAIDGIGLAEVVEMIDIGGPSLVRAAAKNFAHVGVVVDRQDYPAVLAALGSTGQLPPELRRQLAIKAFRHTAAYDSAVTSYLDLRTPAAGDRAAFPERLHLEFSKLQDLRYGENPHQRAAFYREPIAGPASVAGARQLQGKELSFNNILDFDAALALVLDLPDGACAIVKHGNPCGVGVGGEPLVGFQRALACDPPSAFGGVVAFNRNVDHRAAQALVEHFFEGVVAPEFDDEARATLSAKKGLRVMATGAGAGSGRAGLDLRRVAGGLLAQEWDTLDETVRDGRVATARRPTADEWQALEFAWIVARHVKSNAIVYANPERTLGIGAGQMSRVDAARLAVQKALSPLAGAVMASDAFFPFRDGLDVAAEAGITAVVQPGGSIRDEDVIAAADAHGMAMVLTGRRHFRH